MHFIKLSTRINIKAFIIWKFIYCRTPMQSIPWRSRHHNLHAVLSTNGGSTLLARIQLQNSSMLVLRFVHSDHMYVHITNDNLIINVIIISVKPGYCPSDTLPKTFTGECRFQCTNDYNCRGQYEKCCSNGMIWFGALSN